MKNLESFFQWGQKSNLNESVISDLFNLVRRAFGDQKSKLDSLASSYNEEEMEYATEWNKIVSDIDELQLKEAEPDLTQGEKRAYSRQISNKEKLLKTLENKRDKEITFLNKKADSIIGGDSKIASYWDVKKANIESKIAKKLLEYGKKITSKSYTQGLKVRYENAAREAKNAERTFKNYFDVDTQSGKKEEKVKEENVKIQELVDMRLSDFPDSIRKMSKESIREIIRGLKKIRNETLVASDTERDKVFQQSQKISDSEKRKESQEKGYREITQKYRDRISDLRSKITIAQRYD
jgi:hypothetical protein